MNIEGKQKYLKENKKKCRKVKTFQVKQIYLKDSKAIFNRISKPQGHHTMALRCQNSVRNGFVFLQVFFLSFK